MKKKGKEKGERLGFRQMVFTFLLVTLSVSQTLAAEEPYPNRPINIVINYAPGGVMDTHAKILGDRLGELLGQPLVKVHKAGGGGTLGASFAARAKPDGYTLFTGTSVSLIYSPIVKKVDYTWEDFIPLGIYAKGAVRLYVKSDSSYKTLQDFIDDAKKRPGQVKVSSYGRMTHADFVIEVFSRQAGLKLAHIPYKSTQEGATALLGGHVDGAFIASSMGQLETGAFKILAVADHERSKFLPEVKTFKELGYPIALPILYSLCVSSKAPKRAVDALSKGMQGVYKRYGKEVEDALIRLEFLPYFLDSRKSIEEFKKDYELTYAIAKELNMVAK